MKRGFTLIEMIVAIGLFAVVMTISVGTLISVFDENRKAESLKVAMDGYSQVVDTISREMRFGRTYACGQPPVPAANLQPADCANSPASSISFVNENGFTVSYQEVGCAIQRWSEDTNQWVIMSPRDVCLNKFSFYVMGSQPGDTVQPKVFMVMSGIVGSSLKPLDQTTFTVQTLVSQRALDY